MRIHLSLPPLLVSALLLFATGCAEKDSPGNSGTSGTSGTSGSTVNLPAQSMGQEQPLPPEKAFAVTVDALDGKTLIAQFRPAPAHYLYKSKIGFALKNSVGTALGQGIFPTGIAMSDPFFGEQEVYRQPVQITVPLVRDVSGPGKLSIVVTYQGCNERIGLCYSPIETSFDVMLP